VIGLAFAQARAAREAGPDDCAWQTCEGCSDELPAAAMIDGLCPGCDACDACDDDDSADDNGWDGPL